VAVLTIFDHNIDVTTAAFVPPGLVAVSALETECPEPFMMQVRAVPHRPIMTRRARWAAVRHALQVYSVAILVGAGLDTLLENVHPMIRKGVRPPGDGVYGGLAAHVAVGACHTRNAPGKMITMACGARGDIRLSLNGVLQREPTPLMPGRPLVTVRT
jgi:hypothetical protein